MVRLVSKGLVLLLLHVLSFPLLSLGQETEMSVQVKNGIEEDIRLAKEFEQNSDFNQASSAYHKAANAYWTYGASSKAIDCFHKALVMSEKLGNSNALFVINTNIGLIYSDQTDYQNAIKYFTEASKIAEKLGRKIDITSSLLNKSNVLFELGKYDEALAILTKVNELAQELNDYKLLRNTYSLLTKVYDKTGQREESAKYFDLFAAITRKIQQGEMQKNEEEAQKLVSQAKNRVIEVEAQKEATEKELLEKDVELMEKQRFLERAEQESRERLMQIELLNKEKQLQQAIIDQQKLMRNVYIFIIFTTIVIAALIYYSYREKKKANLLLQHKNDEISRQNHEIQSQAEQLSELNKLKDKLFSIISHDLRSPLSSLITLLSLTKQGFFTEEGFQNVLKELSKNVGYTSSLLENLLVWAQSQMSGSTVKLVVFHLHEIVNSKIDFFEDQLRIKSIKINNNIKPEVTLYADKDMIDIVIRNLIANAIKFTSEEGSIMIESLEVGNEVEICVSDTGVGVSKENLSKLFGKEIISTRGTSNEKGSGLGLILCKDFVQLNGGKIWAESIQGKGSKFFFTVKSGKNAPNEPLVLAKDNTNTTLSS